MYFHKIVLATNAVSMLNRMLLRNFIPDDLNEVPLLLAKSPWLNGVSPESTSSCCKYTLLIYVFGSTNQPQRNALYTPDGSKTDTGNPVSR